MSWTVTERGTPEAAWQAWAPSWPALDLTGCGRVVVVAPHPDDEVLGVGGLLRQLFGLGATIELVAVTDGDASHPRSPTVAPGVLAARRRRESADALAALGVGVRTTRLRVPDGTVTDHEDLLARRVVDVVHGAGGRAGRLETRASGTWVVVPWRGDGHPDHEAAGRAAARAADAAGARLLEFPVWTWHWASPDDARVPWHRARRVALDGATRDAKARAAACFRSQIAPLSAHPDDAAVLPHYVLDRLLRAWETVLV